MKKNRKLIRRKLAFAPIITAIGALLVLGAGISPAAGGGGDLFKAAESRTLEASAPTAPGKTLHIEANEAALSITVGSDKDVTVDGVVEVGDNDKVVVDYFLENTKLVLEPVSDGLRLRLVSPMDEMAKLTDRPPRTGIFQRFYKGNKFVFKLSFAARLNIRIPARHSLDIDNAYGDIKVRGITGRLDAANRSGKIQVEECGGELFIMNSYGPVEVPGFAGPVDVKNSSGGVTLRDVKGNARVENSYDAVRFDRIGGNIAVSSKSAAVTGSAVDGDCDITSSYDKVEVKGVKGKLTVRGPSCAVTAEDVLLGADIENSYAAVRAVRIGSGLRVSGNSNAVTADDIGGDAFIRNSYEAVTASKIRGSLEVDASSAGVSVKTVTGNAKIKTSYETVAVEDVGGWLDIQTQSSPVRAIGVKSDASIVTSYSRVEARQIGGKLSVDASSGAVSAEDIGGDVKVKNSYAAVVLRKTSGSIEVRGNSSPINVDLIQRIPKGAKIDLFTTYETVRLTLPEDADVVVAVKAEYGNISSDFPVFHSGIEASKFQEATAKGSIPVRIETSSGDIIVRGRAEKLQAGDENGQG